MASKLTSPIGDRPESPTTSREPDFDDTPDVSELSIHPRGGDTTPTQTVQPTVGAGKVESGDPSDEPAPIVEVGLLNGLNAVESETLTNLIEAFPSIDQKIIKAVARAGEFQTERAFEALLEYSDPNYVIEDETPPPPPPRPSQKSQIDADGEMALWLANQYDRELHQPRPTDPRTRSQQTGGEYGAYEERESSFFDDELPKIGKQLQKGFFETSSKVSEMFSSLRNKIEHLDSDDEDRYGHDSREYEARYGQGTSHTAGFDERRSTYGQIYGGRPGGGSAGGKGGPGAVGDRTSSLSRNPNYDADPHVLDAEELYGRSLRNKSASPLGSAMKAPGAPSRVKSPSVTFADLPSSTSTPVGGSPAVSGLGLSLSPNGGRVEEGGSKKWQPLNQVPATDRDKERERDPFELGDSDDDDVPTSAIKMVDNEEGPAKAKG